MLLIDHARARVGAERARAAGYDGAIRYLVDSPDRGLPNKKLTPDEAKGYLDRAMPLVSNWQRGKDATADWRRGFAGGQEDARNAASEHFRCGGTRWTPIYFSIDNDLSRAEWDAHAADYLRGCADVLGAAWVGMYGKHDAIDWAIADGVIGQAPAEGKHWAWHTNTWHGEHGEPGVPHPAAVLFQRDIYPREPNVVAGIPVDVSVTLAEDFGQWSMHRAPADFLGALTDHEQYEVFAAFGGAQ